MTTPKLCAFFGYDLEQGAKAFCMIEMVLPSQAKHHYMNDQQVMAYVHVLISFCVVRVAVLKYIKHGTEHLKAVRWILFLSYELFLISLVLQGIFGFLMYFIGFVKKKVIIFQVWMGVAVFNLICPLIIMIVGIIGQEEGTKDLAGNWISRSVLFTFLYLLYINFGLVTIYPYIKHLKEIKKGSRITEVEVGATSIGALIWQSSSEMIVTETPSRAAPPPEVKPSAEKVKPPAEKEKPPPPAEKEKPPAEKEKPPAEKEKPPAETAKAGRKSKK